ncbi:unnamed protein product [Amoebophrya sp. A25]|nr:unnamed protein product [Amoebophrya sp. A25]|eukprot:GSA25T00015933001.1
MHLGVRLSGTGTTGQQLSALLSSQRAMSSSSSASRRVFIAGGATTTFLGKGHPEFIHPKHPEFGKKENPDLKYYLSTPVAETLQATGLAGKDVDRLYVGNFAGELFSKQGHLGSALAGVSPDFLYKPSMRIEGACASGGLAVAAAADVLRAGKENGGADVVLVVGAEVQSTVSAREGGGFLARAADFPRQADIDDFAFPCLLARRTKAYLEKHPHLSMDDLNAVVAKAYANGNRNPKAHMHRSKVPLEAAKAGEKNPNFLSNQDFCGHVRMRDCSQVSDGGSCIVMANENGLKGIGKGADLVELVASEYGCGNLYEDPKDLAEMDTCKAVVDRLYARTGCDISKVDVAEVHDCFSIAEILMYEAIGLAAPGEGPKCAQSGVTSLEGTLPVNTGGGLIAFGHPVGATGVKQIHEIYRQMKGQCGEYQLPKKPQVGLAVNMGGDDKTIVATLLKNVVETPSANL